MPDPLDHHPGSDPAKLLRQEQAKSLAAFVRDTVRRLDGLDPLGYPNFPLAFLEELRELMCLECGRTDDKAAGCQCWNDE